jgi:tRNA-Thr(GGU) m(6)t(6)A37 methyltransferase TsaA
MSEIVYQPIGVIHSPHMQQAGTPIQPTYATDVRGQVVVYDEYAGALADLDGFDHIWLLYHFDRAKPYGSARIVPYRDDRARGLFATRVPSRPNPIGMSVVKLISVESNTVVVEGIDVLDGTMLLDIKPYVAAFDAHPEANAGWLAEARCGSHTADERFSREDRA